MEPKIENIRRRTYYILIRYCAAFLLIGIYQPALAAKCGVQINIVGASVVQLGGETTYKIDSQSTTMFGTVYGPVGVDFGSQGFEVNLDLHGQGTYKFRYSGSIKKMTIKIGQKLVYQGAPITSYVGKKGPLEVTFDLRGNADIEISDECSTHGGKSPMAPESRAPESKMPHSKQF